MFIIEGAAATSTKLSRVIGSLTVGRKLALIYFLDLTTVLFISGILISEKYIAINFTKKEIVGNQYIAVVRDALIEVVKRTAETSPGPIGDSASAATIRNAEERFGTDMAAPRSVVTSPQRWQRRRLPLQVSPDPTGRRRSASGVNC